MSSVTVTVPLLRHIQVKSHKAQNPNVANYTKKCNTTVKKLPGQRLDVSARTNVEITSNNHTINTTLRIM